MQQEILDTLFDDREKLSNLIIQLAPTTPEQVKQLQALMQRRDRLSMAIQDVINQDITNSTAGITNACKQLDEASTELTKLAGTFADVASAITLVDQVVNVVAAVVTAASG